LSTKLQSSLPFVYILTAVAAVLRLATLSRKSLWVDEACTAQYATLHSAAALFTHLVRHEIHPPLFFLIERVSVRLLGSGDVALRLIPAVCGVLLVPVAYVLARKALDDRTAVVAAAIVAVHPYFLQNSQEARATVLVGLLVAVAVVLLAILLERGLSPLVCVAFLAVVVSAFWADHLALPAVGGMAVAASLLVSTKRRKELLRWIGFLTVLVILTVPSLWLLHVQLHNDPSRTAAGGSMIKAAAGVVLHLAEGYRFANITVAELWSTLRRPLAALYLAVGGLGFLTLVLAGALDALKERLRVGTVLLVGAATAPLIVILVLGRVDLMKARYLLQTGLPLLAVMLLARGIVRAAEARRRWVLGVAAAWAVVAVVGLVHGLTLRVDPIHKENWRAVAAVAGSTQPTPTVLLCAGMCSDWVFDHYAGPGIASREVAAAAIVPPDERTAPALLLVLGKNGFPWTPSAFQDVHEQLGAAGYSVVRDEPLGADLRAILAYRHHGCQGRHFWHFSSGLGLTWWSGQSPCCIGLGPGSERWPRRR